MIESYYNDENKVELKRFNENGQAYGKLTYNRPIKLHCFVREKTLEVVNSNNQTVVSNTSYATRQIELRENDIINDRRVIAVDRPKGDDYRYWRAYV